MKAVLDTNIFVSGIHWSHGPSGKIIEAMAEDQFELVVSEPILEEILRVLQTFKRPMSDEDVLNWISLIGAKSNVVGPVRKIEVVKADPDDNKFVEAAVAGEADYIVSQDKHLLDLGEFEGIKILRPKEFLELFVSGD